MKRFLLLFCITLVFGVFHRSALSAPLITPDISDVIRQSQSLMGRQPQLQFPKTPTTDFNFQIQRTEKTAVKKAADELEFLISKVEIIGSSYFPDDQINVIFEKYIGKLVTLSDLNEGAELLDEKYRKAGFFLSKVFIPPQKISNGILQVRVVEGFISKVYADGGSKEVQQTVLDLMNSLVDVKPLNLAAVERKILVLNNFPGIAVNTILRQGAELGASEMVVNIYEIPNSYTFSMNNNASKQLGPYTATLSATVNRLLARDNQVTLSLSSSVDLQKYKTMTIKYAEPIGYSGLVASLSYTRAKANPGASYEELDIESQSQIISPRLSYPLIKTRSNSLSLDSGLNFTRSATTIAGAGYTFDKMMNTDLSMTFINTNFWNGLTLINASVTKGLPGRNTLDSDASSPSVTGFNPNFSKVNFLLLRSQTITQSWSAQFGVNGQMTKDTLLSGDTISFGGATVGRGFDNSAIYGDNGLGSYLEIRNDLPITSAWLTRPIQLFAFVDSGTVRNNDNTVSGVSNYSKSIFSKGFGIRTTVSKTTFLELQYARATSLASDTDQRQNPRILFLGTVNF